jgi:hypothetical protein
MSNRRQTDNTTVMSYQSEPGASVLGRLVRFGVGSDKLLLEHAFWLQNVVVPVLQAQGSVAIIGLTSRTGSEKFNLDLSKRRAQAVRAALRQMVGGPFPCSVDTRSDAKWFGEGSAQLAGHKDGSEDPYYRAVIVAAAYTPTPPPPPKLPLKPAAPAIKRVATRKWHKFETRAHGEPGETGMEIGNLVNDIVAGVRKGGSDDRTYVLVPSDHIVSQVIEEFIVDNQMGMGVSSTSYTRTIEYRWGEPVDKVFWYFRTKRIESGIEFAWKIEARDYILRSNIWKRTTAPDATVYW